MSKKKLPKEQQKKLVSLHREIREQIPFINLKPYSHNIISCVLRIIAKEFGYNKANEAIDKLELGPRGWKHHEEPKTKPN